MANYIQPGTENLAPNPAVGVRPAQNANALGVSPDGTKPANYIQPDYRVPAVDERVGIFPPRTRNPQ
jgi:hypothetical protein